MELVRVTSGMVVGPHPMTADAGVELLRAGGNAIDAIVAAAFTEAVVEPGHNGVAGYGGCVVAYVAGLDRVIAIDYNTRAPLAAREDIFPVKYEEDGRSYTVPGRVHLYGPLSVGVPGVVAGLTFLLDRYGTISVQEAVKPAIRAARDGFPINTLTRNGISELADRLKVEFPDTARLLLPNGSPPRRGEFLRNPELAQNLEQIASNGGNYFYHGSITKLIVDFMRERGGILNEEDFARYQPTEVKPLRMSYRDYEIYTPPLCAGGLTTLQILKLLEGFQLSEYKPHTTELYHLLIETMKACWRERLYKYGDPDFVKVDENSELSPGLVEKLRDDVKAGLRSPKMGEVISPEPLNCTSHICAADKEGNVVSLTQTHGGLFGSLVSVPNTGLIFGHGMGRFDPRPRWPNSIAPWKRPLHNMSPIIVFRDGRPVASIGTPGGRTIPNNIAYFIVNLFDLKLPPDEVLKLPRSHVDSIEPVQLETVADKSIFGELREMGHTLQEVERVGGPAHIILTENRDKFLGATDPRGEGKVGYE